MSYSDSIFVATDINVGQGSHFMRLPTEIRDMIYRHLLVAKYTMTEPNMTSKEVSLSASSVVYMLT